MNDGVNNALVWTFQSVGGKTRTTMDIERWHGSGLREDGDFWIGKGNM